MDLHVVLQIPYTLDHKQVKVPSVLPIMLILDTVLGRHVVLDVVLPLDNMPDIVIKVTTIFSWEDMLDVLLLDQKPEIAISILDVVLDV